MPAFYKGSNPAEIGINTVHMQAILAAIDAAEIELHVVDRNSVIRVCAHDDAVPGVSLMSAREPITVVLMGAPVPFARMRLSRSMGGHYIPAPQRNAMAALRIAAGSAMRQQSAVLFDEAICLELLAEFPIPQSWSKKKQHMALLGLIRPGKKPDLDNLCKLATDALNSVVYRDDALIVEMWARKIYSNQPKLVCTIQPVTNLMVRNVA